MEHKSLDFEYWTSRRNKITEEFSKLENLKNEKRKKLEEEQKQVLENERKMKDLIIKVREINPNFPSSESPRSETRSISRLSKLETKEFEIQINEQKNLYEKDDDHLFECLFLLGQINNMDEPGTLFSYPEDNEFANSPQARVLASFAFPTEITSKKFEISSLKQRVKELHYEDLKRDGKHFVFTVKSDTEKPPSANRERSNYKKDLVYCCCVFVEHIVYSEKEYFITRPICYCIVTYFPCFEFLFDLLFFAIKQKREEQWMNIKNYPNDTRSLQDSISDFLLDYDISKSIRKLTGVKVETSPRMIKGFSRQIGEFKYLDCFWFCSKIFSILNFDDFWYVLCAIVHESSIVFIGSNLDELSSCVLGFHGIIRPLYWSHVLTPILPASLFDIIEAPFPLLVGIPSQTNFRVKPKHSHLIIIDLDKTQGSKILNSGEEKVLPDLDLSEFRKTYEEYNLNKNKTDKNRLALKRIVENVNSFITTQLVEFRTLRYDSNEKADTDETIENIRTKNSDENVFKYKFYSTQMSVSYIEDFKLNSTSKLQNNS